jgi:long-subunit fatty acid transport protein
MSRVAGLLILAAFCVPATVVASPQDLFGFGARYVALAATGSSYADGYGAVHANPAGLSRVRRRELTLGYAATGFSLNVNDGYLAADPGSATMIGLSFPLPFGGFLRDRIGMGLGFFTPTQVVVRGRIVRSDVPQFVVLPDRVQSVALQVGIGFDLGRGFRVGAGFMAMAALKGVVLVNADASGRSTSRIDNQLIASYAPVLGASWQRGDWHVGATFRGELIGAFGVKISAPDLGVPIPTLNVAGVAQYDPAQLHLEGSWQHNTWTVALAFTGKQWSAYPGPSEATTEGSQPPPSADFGDTVVPRVAVEHRWVFSDAAQFALRGGYFFEPSPAPTSVPTRQYLDTDRHAITFGTSLGSAGSSSRFTLDFFGQIHILSTRTGVTTVGAPQTFGGSLWHLGITGSVNF